MRQVRHRSAVAHRTEALAGFQGGEGPVERLELFHSTLTPQGWHDTLEHASPLGGGAASPGG